VKSSKNNMENISHITDCIEDSEASQVSSDGEITEDCRGNDSNELQACEEGDQQQVLRLESTDRRIENVTNPSKKLFRSKSKRERCHICRKEMLLQNLKDHMKNAHNSTEVRVLGQKSLIELFGNKVKDNNVKRKRGHGDVDEEPLFKTAKTADLSMSISSGSTPPGFENTADESTAKVTLSASGEDNFAESNSSVASKLDEILTTVKNLENRMSCLSITPSPETVAVESELPTVTERKSAR
jgi:hypothetical protein